MWFIPWSLLYWAALPPCLISLFLCFFPLFFPSLSLLLHHLPRNFIARERVKSSAHLCHLQPSTTSPPLSHLSCSLQSHSLYDLLVAIRDDSAAAFPYSTVFSEHVHCCQDHLRIPVRCFKADLNVQKNYFEEKMKLLNLCYKSIL